MIGERFSRMQHRTLSGWKGSSSPPSLSSKKRAFFPSSVNSQSDDSQTPACLFHRFRQEAPLTPTQGCFIRARGREPSIVVIVHRSISASDFLYLAPEAVTNRRDRDSEPLSNFLPFILGSPERQNRGISLAELSNDLFEIQACIRLADPDIVRRLL